MPDSFVTRLKHGWNAFQNRDPTQTDYTFGPSYSTRPDRIRLRVGNERTIISSIYTRIAMDVASAKIMHVRLDDDGRFKEVIKSGLNRCFNVQANIDQSGRAFIQDVVMSMFDEGCVAIVPVDTTTNPKITDAYDIKTMRTAKIVQWQPQHVRVLLYNEKTGQKEEITLPKSMVAIIENPLYAVMNEPNSTLRRLTHKLSLLDSTDDKISSGRLDLVIQLPYMVKTDARRKQAEDRRKLIEDQMAGSTYGVAYIDGTEKVTQLNRPVENHLLEQIKGLTEELYSQLGLTPSVFNGTADSNTLANYYSRSIDPLLSTIVGDSDRKFISNTARSQNQALYYFKDPFRFIPVDKIPEIADSFINDEISSPNEFRQVIGMRPSSDPKADQFRNRNIALPEGDPSNSNQNGGELA